MSAFLKKLACMACATSLASCASIVGDSTHTMPITSKPDGASIVITDEKNAIAFKGVTPTTVTLNKSDGGYFGGKTYTVQVALDGYEPQTFVIDHHANGWYIGGNILFGGLIGWLIVDPLTGKMYSMSMDKIDATLAKKQAANGPELRVASLDQVPLEMRRRLIPLDGASH